jgi:hypothetical protein
MARVALVISSGKPPDRDVPSSVPPSLCVLPLRKLGTVRTAPGGGGRGDSASQNGQLLLRSCCNSTTRLSAQPCVMAATLFCTPRGCHPVPQHHQSWPLALAYLMLAGV